MMLLVEFVRDSIGHILSLYNHKDYLPGQIVLLGHSMVRAVCIACLVLSVNLVQKS